MTILPGHLRFAVRQRLKNPRLVEPVTLALALGVGVITVIFGLLYEFILRQLPYPEPDRLGVLASHAEEFPRRHGHFERQDNTSQDRQTWESIRTSASAVRAESFGGARGINLQASPGSQGPKEP